MDGWGNLVHENDQRPAQETRAVEAAECDRRASCGVQRRRRDSQRMQSPFLQPEVRHCKRSRIVYQQTLRPAMHQPDRDG